MWYNNVIFLTHIPTYNKKTGFPVIVAFLALVMVAGAMQSPRVTNAADSVCGDNDVDVGEQCDDGNLQNGDGCSSSCTIEKCGNGTTDVNEQCDDGNDKSGDGCNKYCQIEFCGDRIVQSSRGEQCDDGNGVSGDGCSGSCKSESPLHDAPTQESSSSAPTTTQQEAPSEPPPEIAPAIMQQAIAAVQFLNPKNQDAAVYTQQLDREEALQLEAIVKKLANGRRLTKEERVWAEKLFAKLQEAKIAERGRYTDLLKEFIATPISSEVVDEKDLEKSRLVDVEVPIAIDELERAVSVVRRGELSNQVTLDVTKLKRQGIAFEKDIPVNYSTNLTDKNRPIEVFATLKTMKEAAEKYATNDVPASLETIRAEAAALKTALPILEQEYGLSPEDTEPLLSVIESLTQEVSKQDTARVVAAINRFVGTLERRKVISDADLATIDLQAAHTAASVQTLAEQVGRDTGIETTTDMVGFVDGLSQVAPADTRIAFERGGLDDQRDTLLTLITTDERVQSMLETLRKEGRTDIVDQYAELKRAVQNVGDGEDTETPCDDTMTDALRCTNDTFTDLQNAVRNRSMFNRIVSKLQDFFGIGS